MTHRVADSAWFKSSHSSETGGSCVEVADLGATGRVAIRDSKDKSGPVLVVSVAAWAAFVAETRSGVWHA